MALLFRDLGFSKMRPDDRMLTDSLLSAAGLASLDSHSSVVSLVRATMPSIMAHVAGVLAVYVMMPPPSTAFFSAPMRPSSLRCDLQSTHVVRTPVSRRHEAGVAWRGETGSPARRSLRQTGIVLQVRYGVSWAVAMVPCCFARVITWTRVCGQVDVLIFTFMFFSCHVLGIGNRQRRQHSTSTRLQQRTHTHNGCPRSQATAVEGASDVPGMDHVIAVEETGSRRTSLPCVCFITPVSMHCMRYDECRFLFFVARRTGTQQPSRLGHAKRE